MMYQGYCSDHGLALSPLRFRRRRLVGLTGMGGGSLMTPLLILLFGVHPLTAVGTDLLYAAATKTAGTAIHSRKGNVDWRVAGLLAAGSVPATVLTIWVLSRVPKQSPTTATIISMSIGVALIIAAVAIFFRRRIRDYPLARADNPTRTRPVPLPGLQVRLGGTPTHAMSSTGRCLPKESDRAVRNTALRKEREASRILTDQSLEGQGVRW
jgi:uncharacterized membrane protein YfcA